ncbi:MAG: TatD family hydrolase [Candidatus Spechtbacterales bacterium]
MLIDTHGHLNFNAYKDDFEETLERALSSDVSLIMPGSQYSTSKRAVEFAEKLNNPRVWAAVGLHPIHLEERKIDKFEADGHVEYETHAEKFDRKKYEELARSKKVVAVGEVGLDYWWRPKTKEEGLAYAQKQQKTFCAQADMALDLNLPLIIHCRVAMKDMLNILREHPHTEARDVPGVIHSYTGSPKQLKKFLSLGYYIGVNGLVFTLGLVQDAVKAAPLDRILLETDAPYLSPPLPRRSLGEGGPNKTERNEPANVKYVAQKIAELKDIPFKEVEAQTTENAKKVFGIDFK